MKNESVKMYELDNQEISRYSRQLILPEIGKDGQKELKAASVLCIGSGGLGSPLLLYLSAAGMGRLGIVAFDIVEESNLHRQVIHSTKWLGKPKIESAKSRILEINPNCIVDIYNMAITSDNALEIMSKYDVICDGTDNFPTRYLVNDACVLLGKPNVYGSVLRFEGQASVFNLGRDAPNYRDLVPEPPPPGLVPSCAEGGVMGILPGIIGLIQATETIKIITGIGNTLSGRLLVFDALEMSFKELNIKTNKDSPCITKLIDYNEFCGYSNESSIEDLNDYISVNDLNKMLSERRDEVALIDVRSRVEREFGYIKGSILIPRETIEEVEILNQIKEMGKKKTLVLYCKSGIRSNIVKDLLKKHHIYSKTLKGGIILWREEIDQSISVI